MRFSPALLAIAAVGVPSLAAAQTWLLQSGFTARSQYTDNYFFAPSNSQSGFTLTASPFVAAARRTEASEVTALLSLGANQLWLWDPSDTNTFLSGRMGLNGSLREDRSTWTGSVSVSRAPTLQNQLAQTGTVLALAYTNTASINGAYTYALTERWSVGATAGGYGNRYEGIQSGGSTLQNNQGYLAGGNVGYAYSERTQFTLAAVYSHYSSDITRSDVVTTTLGVVHKFSPQLTISASVGGFWSDIEATRTALVCPTTPSLCDTGLVPRVPITSGDQRRDNGHLLGGNISYAFSERTTFSAFLAENLSPSSTGTLNKTDSAGASLSHQFSERLTGRIGASYTRTILPSGLSRSSTTNFYSGEIGGSYRLTDLWTLEAGYRHARAQYSQNGFEPQSNTVFVSVGYGWPGTSFTDWVGARLETQQLPGAGPVPLVDRSSPTPGATPPGSASDTNTTKGTEPSAPSGERSTFDQFSIP